MNVQELVQYLNQILQIQRFQDYAPNGLQVEGKSEIRKIITAVSASQAAIQFTINNRADALLVHHGYFWKGERPELTGIKGKRIAALMKNDLNLLAYHLPLDQHERWGNNALFAQHFSCKRVWCSPKEALLWHAEIEPISSTGLLKQLSKRLWRHPQSVGVAPKQIKHIAWCTGAAQDLLTLAAQEGAQVFISGEYAERTYHEALEHQIMYVSCGHHASERAGVQALGEHLAEHFALDVEFFDEQNPF